MKYIHRKGETARVIWISLGIVKIFIGIYGNKKKVNIELS